MAEKDENRIEILRQEFMENFSELQKCSNDNYNSLEIFQRNYGYFDHIFHR